MQVRNPEPKAHIARGPLAHRLADHVLAGEGGGYDAGLLLLGHEDENLFISFQKLNDSIVLSGHNISEITLM